MTRVVTGDLGWCVARLTLDADGLADQLHIVSPAETSPDRYAPCESVCIVARARIVLLKNFLNQHVHDITGTPKEDACP